MSDKNNIDHETPIVDLSALSRNLISELAALGLDESQCKQVLDWTETLPIHIYMGINYTQVSITQGVVVVQPNQDKI